MNYKKNKNHKSSHHNTQSAVKGIINITSSGVGYVTVEKYDDDIYIETNGLHTAMHNDVVEIIILPKKDRGRQTGEVVKILHRAKMEFVGTIEKVKKSKIAFVVPDDGKMYTDIFIPQNDAEKIPDNFKVLTRIEKWDDPKKNPIGTIIRVIGKKGDNDAEMESIILEKGFQITFPKKVEHEAQLLEKQAKKIPQAEIAKRRDFRNITTFTIDPEDAKDFDDAISFQQISNDIYEIGIHIADVSHYVQEKSTLDKEAYHRGVSVYLVDRTIPMLPEILSNDICSLNPQEEKLTFSAVCTISIHGDIQSTWFGRTIIHSDKRFTYQEAQDVLDVGKGEYHGQLQRLDALAKTLRKKRMLHGVLDFEREEVVFNLDAHGKPVSITKKPILNTHKLVEEFMILANREVALYLSKEIKKIGSGASVYRIHDIPKRGAMKEFLTFLKALGYTTHIDGDTVSSKQLNKIFEKAKGTPEESLIKTIALRSMSKAIYAIDNIGHYGLALTHYTHFTSPIRRYADILVHRILDKHLHNKSLHSKEVMLYREYTIALSQREGDATNAERHSVAYKQVEYMLEKTGEIYEGIISGITKWGVYVEELHTQANGMIKYSVMKDDFYVFDQKTYSIIGTKYKKKYTMGDKVKIKIIGGNLERKTLDYAFVS